MEQYLVRLAETHGEEGRQSPAAGASGEESPVSEGSAPEGCAVAGQGSYLSSFPQQGLDFESRNGFNPRDPKTHYKYNQVTLPFLRQPARARVPASPAPQRCSIRGVVATSSSDCGWVSQDYVLVKDKLDGMQGQVRGLVVSQGVHSLRGADADVSSRRSWLSRRQGND